MLEYIIIAVFIIIIILFIVLARYYYKNTVTNKCRNVKPEKEQSLLGVYKTPYYDSFTLVDFYIKSSFNSCSIGSFKNDYVNLCALEEIIKQGVRCLDFEIYSLNNQPVVSTSSIDKVYSIKETFNHIPFIKVMKVLENKAFSGEYISNNSDPLIIHLRFKTNNPVAYENMQKILSDYDGYNILLKNDNIPLHKINMNLLLNKIIIIVDSSNKSYQGTSFEKYVNGESNSNYLRKSKYTDIKYTPDVNELINFNKVCLTIVMPDNDSENINHDFCKEVGCQMTAMMYQLNDDNLKKSDSFFETKDQAFVLKPDNLRYIKQQYIVGDYLNKSENPNINVIGVIPLQDKEKYGFDTITTFLPEFNLNLNI